MSSGFDLPEDIVVEILCRLPVKSLIRFTCVSKRWLSIISDPKFRKSHFQLASQLKTISRKVLLISYPTVREPGARCPYYYPLYPTTKLPPRFQILDDKLSVKTFTFPFHERRVDMNILGSCNGLVLLGQYCCENLCVWNLSTGFFRKISDPCFPSQRVFSADGTMLSFTNHGFGYVSASDDYKLVFVVPALGDLLEVHIFSLRANIWKVIRVPYWSWPGCSDGEQGTFINGAIHWVIGRRTETSEPVIYAFDLAKEEFRNVILPPVSWQNEEDDDPIKITTVDHLGGYLCIWSRERYDPTQGEVWAMTVYGVPESWVRLFQFDIYDFPDVFTESYIPWNLCFITESGTMVINLRNELFWIECRNEEKPVCSRRYRLEEVHPEVPGCSFYSDAIAYDETLISVAE